MGVVTGVALMTAGLFPDRRKFAPFALWLCFAMLMAVCGVAGGQQPGSSAAVARTIEGSVLDHAGHSVPGAVVLIEDLKSLQVRSYLVQEDGKFRFRGLSSDANYELRARFNGVASNTKTVSAFETHPVVVVNLTLTVKPKRSVPPRMPSPDPGNHS